MITNRSYTPMRPLVMDFPDDVKAQNIGDHETPRQ
jgi:alpha-glucosidase (family GH31 glycosyl hydrolase)